MFAPRFQILVGFLSVAAAQPLVASEPIVRFERQLLTDQYYCDGVAAGDIDGDGDLDIVAGPYWYEGPDFVSSHAFYEPVSLSREASPSNSMFSFVHDFSGDGCADILVLGRVHKHEAKWYENPGTLNPGTLNPGTLNPGTLDPGTSKLDDGKVKPGDPDRLWTAHYAFERVRGESPDLVDIDGDGTLELICHWEGRWGWIAPDASDPYRPWQFRAIGSDEGWNEFYHGEGVGDVNGDGRLDLIINDGWYEQPASDGDSTLWTYHLHRFSQGRGGAQILIDDVDGDGDHDVISAIDAHGWGLAWYEHHRQDSGIRFQEHLIMGDRSQQKQFGVAFTQPHALDLADVDGDGLQDIVTGKRRWAHGPDGDIEPSADPVVYWFRLNREQDGSVHYEPHLIDDNSGVGVQVLAIDIDADQRTDVVTASKLGTFLFRNQQPALSQNR